ncbi:MAG: tRNA uridine-5-carboxymethylaminomethyl(34) synthesis GTPase MnmE [Synergistaceae bacterium]|jgi:tRNA modification GTPase|nr:tRNA uridine-5-carboxymethylaminomethyl(34) synthesis GTPase MnmE [Synergistaceae bacterium]
MLFSNDVIAAVATAWGDAAIAIVRLSGPGSVELADKCFRGARPLSREPARRMALGNIVDASGLSSREERIIDQVLAVRFTRGASYTGEESVEVQCHGGVAAAQACMDIFLRSGARMAMPGEFTKRAFLSGRIDLTQAEAVLGVIRSRSDAELDSSARSLQGELSDALRNLSREINSALAGMEVRMDYPEEVEDSEWDDSAAKLSVIRRHVSALLERCRIGLVLKNGAGVAIVGRPNVGKSSLLNSLSGEDRAIVTDIPGTTRDTLDVSIIHRGIFIKLIDTAGMRYPGDSSGSAGVIESMGIERSQAAIAGADICALVVDSSAPLTDADFETASALRNKRALLVANKSDLPGAISDEDLALLGSFETVLRVSALTGEGVGMIKDAIFDIVVGDASLSEGVFASERMISALIEADACIAEAESALVSFRSMDAAGSLLAEASEHIASPLGLDATEELLDEIFKNYCVGK